MIEGGPRSVRARAQQNLSDLPIAVMGSSHFNSIGRIARVRMPILFLHSREHARIPIAHGRVLFDSSKAPKRFVELAGSLHDVFRADSAKYFREYFAVRE